MNVKSKELQDLVNIQIPAMKFSALLVQDFHCLFPSLHFAGFTISMQFKDQIVFPSKYSLFAISMHPLQKALLNS